MTGSMTIALAAVLVLAAACVIRRCIVASKVRKSSMPASETSNSVSTDMQRLARELKRIEMRIVLLAQQTRETMFEEAVQELGRGDGS